jgi:hypothetical protein
MILFVCRYMVTAWLAVQHLHTQYAGVIKQMVIFSFINFYFTALLPAGDWNDDTGPR